MERGAAMLALISKASVTRTCALEAARHYDRDPSVTGGAGVRSAREMCGERLQVGG